MKSFLVATGLAAIASALDVDALGLAQVNCEANAKSN